MANSKSAEKRVRQIKTKTERNTAIKSKVKTFRKKALEAAEAGNKDEATQFFRQFVSTVDKAMKKNIYQKNTAANMKSRTNARLKAQA